MAEKIAERFNDGQTFADASGVTLEEALESARAWYEVHPDCPSMRRWTLPDGSVITSVGSAWDLGYPECWCWAGVGHSADCEAAG
jgi:hypothetical protein